MRWWYEEYEGRGERCAESRDAEMQRETGRERQRHTETQRETETERQRSRKQEEEKSEAAQAAETSESAGSCGRPLARSARARLTLSSSAHEPRLTRGACDLSATCIRARPRRDATRATRPVSTYTSIPFSAFRGAYSFTRCFAQSRCGRMVARSPAKKRRRRRNASTTTTKCASCVARRTTSKSRVFYNRNRACSVHPILFALKILNG